MLKKTRRLLTAAALLFVAVRCWPQPTTAPEVNPPVFEKPLSLLDAVNIAIRQNATILKAQQDIEAAKGISIQTRAVVLPKLRTVGNYEERDPNSIDRTIEQFVPVNQTEHLWSSNIRLVQSIYEGGRLTAAWRTARLTREQALLNYQTMLRQVLLDVRVAYADVLGSAEQITVQQASVQLLERQLNDARNRFNQGMEPPFSVLRAEVEAANARPRLIRARNGHRLAKQRLLHLLGYDVPKNFSEDLPLQLSDALKAEPLHPELSNAISRALTNRSELASLEKSTQIHEAAIKTAKSGYKPGVEIFGGYGFRNSEYDRDLLRDISGWTAGVQLSWSPFDGLLTQGKIQEAKARLAKSRIELTDARRQIELDVRTAYSNFVEAQELLESQRKVIDQADDALRMAQARYQTGTATQLDLLSAQTALTEARSTQVQALRDYMVAVAQLDHAMGD